MVQMLLLWFGTGIFTHILYGFFTGTASAATQQLVGKIDHTNPQGYNHNKTKHNNTLSIFHGIYCVTAL